MVIFLYNYGQLLQSLASLPWKDWDRKKHQCNRKIRWACSFKKCSAHDDKAFEPHCIILNHQTTCEISRPRTKLTMIIFVYNYDQLLRSLASLPWTNWDHKKHLHNHKIRWFCFLKNCSAHDEKGIWATLHFPKLPDDMRNRWTAHQFDHDHNCVKLWSIIAISRFIAANKLRSLKAPT